MGTNSIRLLHQPADQRVQVFYGGQLFTAYIYPDCLMKPVLYPVMSPGNHPLTRGFPLDKVAGERIDHPHHVGIWLNYGDVNGLDFWNHSLAIGAAQKHRYGTIRHRQVLDLQEGGDWARLVVACEWLKPDGSVLLDERTEFRFGGGDDERLIDRSSTLVARGEEVLFRDNKEGMVAIRVARALEHPTRQPECFTDAAGQPTDVPVLDNAGVTGHYYSSEGREGDDVWGTRGRWVNLAGRVGDEEISLIIVDHPGNPGYPTYWHARGYGLFAANPLGQAAMSNGRETMNFHLRQGEQVTFKHRFVVHSGNRPDNHTIGSRYATW